MNVFCIPHFLKFAKTLKKHEYSHSRIPLNELKYDTPTKKVYPNETSKVCIEKY